MIQIGCLAGLLGGLVVLLIALLTPRKVCPNCNEKLPRFRKPASGRQAAYGGWTCPNCGAEVDRTGKLVAPGSSPSSPATPAAIVPADTRTCPRCAETIQMDALVCKHCGLEFSEADVQAARQVAEAHAAAARQAAEIQAAEARQAADAQVAAARQLRQAQGRRTSGVLLLIVGIVLAVIGGIAALAFTFYAFSEQAQSTGAFAAFVPLLCTLPLIAIGVWFIILGVKRRQVTDLV